MLRPLRLLLFALAPALAVALFDCGSKHAHELRGAVHWTEQEPAPPASRSPSSASAPLANAPCGGVPEGSYRCDGNKLLRCGASGAELVRSCFAIERCSSEQGSCEPACPEGEVYIPETGSSGFIMGKGISRFGFGSRASRNPGIGPADTPHKVVLTRPFCMDVTEVTAAAYEGCVKERGCKPPKISDPWLTYQRKPKQPENMIDFPRSKYFCEQYGKSLPTEAQWEWAATGGDGRSWPWGNEPPTCERADFTAGELISPGGDSGCHGGGPSPVGTHPEGDRIWPSGRIHDLAGNVWEWCLDSYVPYSEKDEIDPLYLDPNNGSHIVRGGGWNRSARGIMAAFRGAAIPTYTVPGLGFRCVRNAETKPEGEAHVKRAEGSGAL
jgi:formylglycine-generating enzyme required for sulfatase activity